MRAASMSRLIQILFIFILSSSANLALSGRSPELHVVRGDRLGLNLNGYQRLDGQDEPIPAANRRQVLVREPASRKPRVPLHV